MIRRPGHPISDCPLTGRIQKRLLAPIQDQERREAFRPRGEKLFVGRFKRPDVTPGDRSAQAILRDFQRVAAWPSVSCANF